MQKSNVLTIQLFVLSIALPLVWKFSVYLISPFSFVEDSSGSIRFLVFCLLIFVYFKPLYKTLISNIINLFFFFIAYSITLYLFDIIIHFGINKELKIDYLNFFYEKYYDESAKEELRNIDQNYSVASKSEMINQGIRNSYSIQAYVKSFLLDLVKYIIIAVIIGKTRFKKNDKKEEALYS